MMNGDYQFTASYLNLNGLNVGNGNFVVDASGNVSIKGSITMAAGSYIDWSLVREENTTQSVAYNLANNAWVLAGDAQDLADSAYTYAGNAYNLAWDNMLTDVNVFNVLTDGGTRFGIFSDSTSNRLYINADYIRTGTIDASRVTLGLHRMAGSVALRVQTGPVVSHMVLLCMALAGRLLGLMCLSVIKVLLFMLMITLSTWLQMELSQVLKSKLVQT